MSIKSIMIALFMLSSPVAMAASVTCSGSSYSTAQTVASTSDEIVSRILKWDSLRRGQLESAQDLARKARGLAYASRYSTSSRSECRKQFDLYCDTQEAFDRFYEISWLDVHDPHANLFARRVRLVESSLNDLSGNFSGSCDRGRHRY